MALVGLEPKTFELLARRSNQTELESQNTNRGQIIIHVMSIHVVFGHLF